MTDSRSLIAAPEEDPLRTFGGREYGEEFYPFGFPASITSNSPAILEAARENWSGLAQRYDTQPLDIRCMAAASPAQGRPPVPVFRAQGNLLTAIADAENFWCADLLKGFAFGWVTESAAARADYVRYHFLEGMVNCLLDMLHMVALHAACVSLEGRGVLLAGDSGAGKSSLAYACTRRGWTYTTDDASWLVRRAEGRVVLGNPRLIRFRETAGTIFPEFEGMKGNRRGNGKPTIEVRADSLPGMRTATESNVERIVFLNRRDAVGGRVEIRRVPGSEAVERIFRSFWPRELPAHAEREAAVQRLAGARAVEMRYRDLDAAVDCLERIVRDD